MDQKYDRNEIRVLSGLLDVRGEKKGTIERRKGKTVDGRGQQGHNHVPSNSIVPELSLSISFKMSWSSLSVGS